MKTFRQQVLPSIIVLLLIISCFNTYSQSKLPAAWSHDMTLKITYGGGMRNYSSTTFISSGGSYIETTGEDGDKRTVLDFTQQELNDLLACLKANKFDKIISALRKGIVYDMGTTTHMLTWGEQLFGISEGATMEVPASYEKQYETVCQYLDRMLAKKLQEQKN